MIASSSNISKIHAGAGRIALSFHGGKAWLSELSATYPLKLLSPRLSDNGVAIVYALTYGGGLVGGDCIRLAVNIESDAKLLLLSQGSTKVFKNRIQQRLASVQRTFDHPSLKVQDTTTLQKMDFTISSKAALFLLPDPVTCFRSASYTQIQTFHVSKDASLAVLDWVTSGRKSIGEDWVLSRYYSVNEVMIAGRRVAKDVMLLENNEIDSDSRLNRSLKEKLSPYSCYATLILRGPMVEETITQITTRYEGISVMQRRAPEDLLWSLSPIGSDKEHGVIIRVAGKETEIVKNWLKESLMSLEQHIGVDTYRRAFV
ncbi:UreD urease accessory protein-domain-containing protein [Lentinula aciculospora]|uniref:UreD urease accessory protein-domain-containing protein n=1 Tax=Lentinula aciculospora TaxID=153920 RepID=A0A9W9DUP6_9AGAR|nr:UreD urease accessory protein-domain-containing protein [Lentinula aciculospora]